MSERNCVFVCSVILLLVVSSSKSQQNSTKNEEEDDNLIRYEIYTDSSANYSDKIKIIQHDPYKKLINNTQYDKTQYEFNTNNNREDSDLIQLKLDNHLQSKDDEQISTESHTNSTNINLEENFTSQADRKNLIERNDSMLLEDFKNSSKDNNKSNIVPNEICYNDTCIRLCCPLGDRLDDDKCIPEGIEYIFPHVYTNDSMQSENKTVDELFQLAIYDPCEGKDHSLLPENFQYDYMIFVNGSIYLSYYKIFVKSVSYCLAVVDENKFEVSFCSETFDEIENITKNDPSIYDVQIIYVSFHIVSILLLLSVFLVYSILPQLRNIHGFMLRNYSAALSVAYTVDVVNIIIKSHHIQYPLCVTIAFFNYFCFLAGFFWLIMISFDMWCTFRGFGSLQRNVKKREQRKLVYYTIFAWGCPFIFAVFCVTMDSVSEYTYIPQILQPQFLLGDCWFHGKGAFVLYYYGLKSVCIISSICLSISTALKIARYEKDTGLRLTDSESKRYNDNKKWFSLYLKLFIVLFIVMGVKWSVMTVSWLVGNISNYVSVTVNLVDITQNLCTFVIFVCKKKIRLMLLKRFGLLSQAQSDTIVTSSTTTSEVPMQEKMSSYTQGNVTHVKSSPNGTEL